MMRSMTRWALAGSMALAALSAVAVLDVGSRTAEAAPSVSPFAGSWSGTWSGDYDQDGTFDWTISDGGVLTGRILHTQDGESGAIQGQLRADGKLMFVVFTPADDPSVHGCGFPHQGTAVINDDGQLVASFSARYSGGGSFAAILERN